MKEFRLFILPVILGITLVIITASLGSRQELRQKAAPATAITFTPPASTVKSGESFVVDIMVATGDNTISAADIAVSFDKEYLRATSITTGDFLTTVLMTGEITDTKATITLASPPTTPKKGNGKLATLTFQAKAQGITRISFGESTQIAGIGEQGNVVVNKTPATVTIAPSNGSQSTSTPTPTMRQNVTPTPIQNPGSRKKVLISPTMTPVTLSPSPVPTNLPVYSSAFGGLMRGRSQQNVSHPLIPQPDNRIQSSDPILESNLFTVLVLKIMKFFERIIK